MKVTVTVKVESDDGRRAAVQHHIGGHAQDLLSLGDGEEKTFTAEDAEWNVFEITPEKPAEPEPVEAA